MSHKGGSTEHDRHKRPAKSSSRHRHSDFLASLPRESFTELELLLYRAFFSFLAGWRKLQLATVTEACHDDQVRRIRTAFLPKHVPFEAWLDQRIGAEVELTRPDPGGEWLLGLRPVGAQTLASWSARQQERLVPATVAPPLAGRSIEKATAEYGGHAGITDRFFGTLQPQKLAPPEMRLRAAMIDFLRGWRQETPALLDEVQNSEPVRSFGEALMPAGVSMRQWIDYRIGEEVQVHRNPAGQYEALLGEEVRRLCQREASPAPGEPAAQAALDAQVRFFEGLPKGKFLPDEVELRQSVLDWLGRWEDMQSNTCPLISEVSRDPAVARSAHRVLSPQVPLHVWIDSRIGREVGFRKDFWGRRRVQVKSPGSEAEGAESDEGSSHGRRRKRGRSERSDASQSRDAPLRDGRRRRSKRHA